MFSASEISMVLLAVVVIVGLIAIACYIDAERQTDAEEDDEYY